MSFYECLKALPEGSDSSSRLALAAKRLGYQGLIVCNAEPEIYLPDAASGQGIEVTLELRLRPKNSEFAEPGLRRNRFFHHGSRPLGRDDSSACEDPRYADASG
jgi:hypothetical protein